MSSSALVEPCLREKKGSFFKLIDSFAWEIGTLKKEMVQKAETAERDTETVVLQGLDGEMGSLFLRSPPCGGVGAGWAGARDSGYDSPRRRMSVLDRLVQTHAVWLCLGLSHADATHILQTQPTGTFVVRKSTNLHRKVISLRMDHDSETPVKDFPVKESQYTFSLEGSGLSFADLFRLVAFCCISRDVLPFTLKLPEAISAAKTPTDLEEVAKLGTDFWDSELCRRRKSSVAWLSGVTSPNDVPGQRQRSVSTDTTVSDSDGRPRLRTRSPAQLECCQSSSGALCFINPLFLKVHHPEGGDSLPPTPSSHQDTLATPVVHDNNNTDPLDDNGAQYSSDIPRRRSDRPLSQPPSGCSVDSPLSQDGCRRNAGERVSWPNSVSRSPPPPRPPPPRCVPRRPPPLRPLRQHSMPEKISWINPPKDKGGERERGSSLLSRLGSSLSISPSSSSPPKRLSISVPISIPRPSLPPSLSLSSSPPCRAKPPVPSPSPSPGHLDPDCHSALDDETIENAVSLSLAKLSLRNNASSSAYNPDDGGGDGNDDPPLLQDPALPPRHGEEGGGGRGGGGGGRGERVQRLSDMSLSTDSSDSLDFSSHGGFFFPPLLEPSPPAPADMAPLPPLTHPYSSMEEEEEDEDEDDDEDEPDYGVSLESDQEQDHDLNMAPPGLRSKRRASAGALVIRRALRGHLRKMSGVFLNSLLTPERRAVRKVLELSRDKGSYFGSLVQDYLSYLQEGGGAQAWQGHASGLELLQTLRQFITQMKSYLRQSSELEPPIESLIPEDQIDQVLEKAMHKCVLKPLKGVVGAALQEFQVRSGAWRELKENLSLAKARLPQEMGVADALPPDPVAIEKIRHKFHTMCKLYSPEKKVTLLLRVCKLIYTIMEDNSGRMYGADDFLPMLTYVLAQCDMPQLDNEILYMMELLDPSLLHGEGGYYLTSAYGAMSLIRNFQEEQAARVLSSETRNTLHQWHRRRTTLRTAPSVDDFQNYLRVALQELDSGCTAKTLLVHPYATTEEVCQICAHKFKVHDPQSYALFLLTEGSSQQLAPDTYPQKIKAELHSRPEAAPFHFVFRRLVNSADLPVTPHDPQPNLNDLTVTYEAQPNLNDVTMTSDSRPDLSEIVPSSPDPDPDLSYLTLTPSSDPLPNMNLGLCSSLSLSLPPNKQDGSNSSF